MAGSALETNTLTSIPGGVGDDIILVIAGSGYV
jgi:hypothetical protein